MPRFFWMDDITENLVTACFIKVQNFFESICSNIQLKSSIWMDVNITKMRKYEWSAVYQHKNNSWVRYLSVCCRCSLPSWLLFWCYCNIHTCWSAAIVTTITTILVWCKCNRQHRKLDIALTNINAGPAKVYQTCMLVGASLTDIAAG